MADTPFVAKVYLSYDKDGKPSIGLESGDYLGAVTVWFAALLQSYGVIPATELLLKMEKTDNG